MKPCPPKAFRKVPTWSVAISEQIAFVADVRPWNYKKKTKGKTIGNDENVIFTPSKYSQIPYPP